MWLQFGEKYLHTCMKSFFSQQMRSGGVRQWGLVGVTFKLSVLVQNFHLRDWVLSHITESLH